MVEKKSVKLYINPGNSLLLSGRGRTEVRQGQVEILGAILSKGASFKVRLGRQIPIFSPEFKSIIIGEGFFKWVFVREDPIPSSWRAVIDELLVKPNSTIVIIGQTDSGKSTLSQFLSNSVLNFSKVVGLVDADVGQSDLGPPGFISASLVRRKVIDLRNIKPITMEFVGALSPSRAFEESIDKVKRVKESLLLYNPDYIIINTDGWLDNEGVAHKKKLIEKIKPDIVIELCQGESLIKEGNYKLITLNPPSHVMKRTQVMRRLSRLANIVRFLKGAEAKVVKRDEILFLEDHEPRVGDVAAVYENDIVRGIALYGGELEERKEIFYTRVNSFTKIVMSDINAREILDLIKGKTGSA
ncbi:MAG: Clp1/GlmU family protein [Thermoproteota archaeon]